MTYQNISLGVAIQIENAVFSLPHVCAKIVEISVKRFSWRQLFGIFKAVVLEQNTL